MKLFSVLVLACSVLSTQGEETCDAHCEACKDTADIAKISCDGTKCTVVNGALEDGSELDYLGDDETTMDEKLCRIKCEDHAENVQNDQVPCKFFRYEDEHLTNAAHCSLQSECPLDQTCERPYCVTGELGCNDACKSVTHCKLTKKSVWNHDKFHVICVDGEDINGDINIYEDLIANEPRIIPAGTVCSTVRMCPEWSAADENENTKYKRKLAIFCDGDDGQWKAYDQSCALEEAEADKESCKTGDEVKSLALISSGEILEPGCCVVDKDADGCTCAELTDDTGNQDWADLICDHPVSPAGKVTDPNSCMLLCDNHLTKSFSCKFDIKEAALGEKKWLDISGEEVTEGNVKC